MWDLRSQQGATLWTTMNLMNVVRKEHPNTASHVRHKCEQLTLFFQMLHHTHTRHATIIHSIVMMSLKVAARVLGELQDTPGISLRCGCFSLQSSTGPNNSKSLNPGQPPQTGQPPPPIRMHVMKALGEGANIWKQKKIAHFFFKRCPKPYFYFHDVALDRKAARFCTEACHRDSAIDWQTVKGFPSFGVAPGPQLVIKLVIK